jgi:glycine/D-amino acid oxidase-like deaminating enzyme
MIESGSGTATEVESFDTVVVGAGIGGCMAARDLAADRDVLVLDRSGVAAAATGRSAGLVAPTLFFGDLPPVAHHANAFVREFDGTRGFEFTARNRVDLVTDGERAEAEATAERRAADGFPVDYLDAATVHERYPALRMDGFAGAVEYRDTGWVDPHSYATALAGEATDRGATVETGATVTGLVVEDGAVAGVETTLGTYRAEEVVVAAGWRTRDLLADHLALPVRPYRTQCVVLEPSTPLDGSFPLVRVGSDHLYARPEHNGDLLVGGMAALTDDPAGASTNADEAFRRQCAAVVPDLFHGFDTAGVVNDWAGVDAATPDARPVIDAPAEGPEGLVVVTGFNGLGVMLSPVVGPAVRELFGGEAAGFSLDPFSLGRFDEGEAEFALTSTSDV